MKKILYILLITVLSINTYSQSNNCCPEFNLQQLGSIMPCPGDTTCKESPHGNPDPGGGSAGVQLITACKNSVQTYHVFPNLPGFTYSWQIVGGTPVSFTGNPAVITWGSGNQGFIQVIVSDASGNCRDTITRKVCLLNSPIAAFTVAPSTTICVSQSVLFNNTSSGAVTYSWDFGDGTGSTLANPPPHTYSTPGTYTVVLTVSNGSSGSANGVGERCGCSDTATAIINVIAGNGPVISSPNCKKMLCPGDTATYCVSPACPPYTWTVNGGNIIGPSNGPCITVQWNNPPLTYPTSVSVTTGCNTSCSNTATLNVPVLYNNIPISGPNPVCVGTTATYSLPVLPGTFYSWSVAGGGGGTIVAADSNTASVSIQWNGPPGNAIITCNYNNPYSGCSGSTTMNVNVRKKFIINGPSPLCVNSSGYYSVSGGGNANWTISPATGYTISGSTTGVTGINVNWTTAGNYTITAVPSTLAMFCNSSSSVNVIVKPKPVLTPITGPSLVCPGNYYTYSVSSNMNGPFTWSATNGTIVSQMGTNNDSIVVQWSGTGAQSLSVSQTVNGCTSSVTLSPVNNIPVPTITGTATGCRDQSFTYTASGALPPGSYTWTITPAAAGTITAGQGSNTITVLWHGGTSPGNSSATVSVTVCNYTPVNYPVTITTPPNVTVSKTGSLCTSGVTLSVSPALPCYQWYLNGNPISGATSATYLATTYGYYEVRCPSQCSGYGGIFVPREYIPNVTISADNYLTWCTGSTINVNLISASHPGCTLLWYKNGVSTGATSGTLNVTTTGSYYVVVTCGNCKDTSNTLTVSTIQCDPGPGCDFSYVPKNRSEYIGKPGPSPWENPAETAPFTATLNINPPTNPCNNPQFSANYSFTGGHSLNSGIHWDFGDNTTASTIVPNGTGVTPLTPPHAYTMVGTYIVTAWADVNCPPPPTPHTCRLIDTIHYTVPIAANFNFSVNCDKIYLSNLSSVISGCNITAYSWTATGPGSTSFNSSTIASPVLTVTQSGTYNVTLTVTSSCNACTATLTLPVTVVLPSASFTAPSPVCAGTPVAFNAPSGSTHYLWNFGDGFTSSLQNTTHAFGLTPSNPTITLTATNAMGCVATATQTINVIAPPALTITPDQFICPGTTATITASTGFTNYTFYHNGNIVQNGTGNTYTTGAMGTYWVVATSSGGGCVVTSAQTHIFYKPKPVANIQGSSVACLSGGIAYIYLYNSVNDPTYTYNWTLQGNNTSLSTTYDLNTTVNAVGNYSYVLTVTNSDGCVASDTFCVVVGQSPQVTVTPSSGGVLCAGTLYTFTASATPPNPNYIYQWNNGVTGPVMSTSMPGMYSVNVIDPANGCSGFGFAGMIQPRPSTILFPIGCDTICDTDSIIPPLALGTGQNYSMYTIQWFLNGNYGSPIYTGPVLNLGTNMPPLVYGMNNISIVVTWNGCSDTSSTYNLFIKNCSDCDCKESKWTEMYWHYNSDDPKNPVKKSFKCNDNLGVLDCNKPITIFAAYDCNPDSCNVAVTYQLTGPVNQSGTVPFTTAGLPQGSYTLTLIGMCGDTICNRCIIRFTIKCEECNCKGSTWGSITMSQVTDHQSPAAAKAVIGNVPGSSKLNCNKTYDIKCNITYTINAVYNCPAPNCPGTVQYVLTGPMGTSSGNVPVNFTPTATGTYTLTLYGYCGTTKCDSCVIKFNVKCDPKEPPPCCPYEISVKEPVVQTAILANPSATIANANFAISGPAGNLFTEIRADVISYNLFSNFNNECLSCKSYPYTWSSMYQPGNIGTIPPQITMFGGTTVPVFNPAGNGMYQNPREVTWNNGGAAFALPSNINLSFLLPPASIIDCCELTAKICVKFTFRDKDCKECEVIVCFTVVIKPAKK